MNLFARPPKPRHKATTVMIWVGVGVLAFVFLLSGATKLAGQQMNVDNFARWGYPTWFMYAVGAVEVGAALLLLYPRTAWLGAGILFADMVGATLTHIQVSEWAAVPVTMGLMAISLAVAWGRRPPAVRRRPTVLPQMH